MQHYSKGLPAVLVLALAVGMSGCGSPRHSHTAAPAQSTATAAPPASRPLSPNVTVCRQFRQLAGPLTAALGGAATHPAAFAAPKSRKAFSTAANLLQGWSKTATDVVTGTTMISLALDMLLASQELQLVAASLRASDPNTATYALDARRGVAEVSSDCASVLGN